ncbi:MAG: hypothetical protein LQ338_007219 [Usnochroma carphineum]|nr:MAG: hypothetical protein LQ338_007219 [Usnochroma carphineum]
MATSRDNTPAFDLLSSQYPGVLVNAMVKDLKDRLGRSYASVKERPSEPTPLNLPSRTRQTGLVDPEDPLATPWQRIMWSAFESFGRVGIARVFYRKAAEEAPNASWEKLLADERSGEQYVVRLLMGLTDDAIRSLIRGTLPHDITLQQNSDLYKFVRDCMVPRAMPSIYCMAPASSTEQILVASGRSRPREHAGKWLTPDQAQQLVDKCRDYITDSPNALAMNQAIDGWKRKHRYTKPDRRWKSGVFEEWLQNFEDLYCGNIDPNKKNVPWTKVPFEVGFAVNTEGRLKQHAGNQQTNSIWALVHAITRLPTNLPGAQGFGFPPVRQWELFPLYEDNEKYAQLGEIVGSLLCSSYWTFGGLNPIYAGTAILSKHVEDWPQDAFKWKRQARTLAIRIQRAEYPDIEHDRFDTRRRTLAALKSLDAKRVDSQRLVREQEEKARQTQEKSDKWKQKLRELGALRKQLANQRQQSISASQDPEVTELLNMERDAEEANLIRQFTKLNPKAIPDAHEIEMEEQGIPDHVREEVRSCREEREQEAERRLDRAFGLTDPSRAKDDASEASRRRSPSRILDIIRNYQKAIQPGKSSERVSEAEAYEYLPGTVADDVEDLSDDSDLEDRLNYGDLQRG